MNVKKVLAVVVASGCGFSGSSGKPDASLNQLDAPSSEVCRGPAGWKVCVADPSPGMITLTGPFNTTNDGHCMTPTPTSWTSTQGDACVVSGTQITVTDTLRVTGARPLVLVATQTILVDVLDASSTRAGVTGPGAIGAPCATSTPGATSTLRGGGGGGGSFATKGGDGGDGDGGNATHGLAGNVVMTPYARLRGGCAGGAGGTGAAGTTGPGAAGGGAVYLTAPTITITGGINLSGAGGGGGTASRAGGGGGGSGGMLVLDAMTLTVSGKIAANGGGGGGGADNSTNGSLGNDPSLANPSTIAAGGNGGGGAGGNGGSGAAGGTLTGVTAAQANDGAGGGGGGLGVLRVLSGQPLSGPLISPSSTN